MFLNDPILYGATFPYRELQAPVQPLVGQAFLPWQTQAPVQPLIGQPFLPWQTMARTAQPYYGFQVPYFGYTNPYLHTVAINPFLNQPYGFQTPTFNVPQMNWIRPFGC